MNINIGILSDLSQRLFKGERVKPEIIDILVCFQALENIYRSQNKTKKSLG